MRSISTGLSRTRARYPKPLPSKRWKFNFYLLSISMNAVCRIKRRFHFHLVQLCINQTWHVVTQYCRIEEVFRFYILSLDMEDVR